MSQELRLVPATLPAKEPRRSMSPPARLDPASTWGSAALLSRASQHKGEEHLFE